MSRFIRIVCGLKSEANAVRISLKAAGVDASTMKIGVSGANADRAEEIAQGFLEEAPRRSSARGSAAGSIRR